MLPYDIALSSSNSLQSISYTIAHPPACLSVLYEPICVTADEISGHLTANFEVYYVCGSSVYKRTAFSDRPLTADLFLRPVWLATELEIAYVIDYHVVFAAFSHLVSQSISSSNSKGL